MQTPLKVQPLKVQPLKIQFEQHWVGDLLPAANGGVRFQYAESWLKSSTSFPLSQSLPLQQELLTGDVVTAFFTHLLPQDSVRGLLSQRLGLSPHNSYGLLEQLGGDCAGAINIMVANTSAQLTVTSPVEAQDQAGESSQSQQSSPPLIGHYQPLAVADMNELLAYLPQHPLLAGTGDGIRLCLGGTQHKLPLYFQGQQFHLPRDGAASTHIIKPPQTEWSHTVANEAYCMWLARACGLLVPDVFIYRQTVEPLLVVERFDRQSQSAAAVPVRRLHQENFCQALGVLPQSQHEQAGGPGWRACRELMEHALQMPAVAKRRMLSWVLFNLVIGNTQVQAKHLALRYDTFGQPQHAELAPFYDLFSTAVYGGNGQYEWLTSYGGQHNLAAWLPRHREQLLQDLGVTGRLARQVVKQLSSQIEQQALSLAENPVFTHQEQKFTRQLAQIIVQRLPLISEF